MLTLFLFNSMCGICGNFNGNRNDDYNDKNGEPTKKNPVKIGNSWQVPDDTNEGPA